MKKYRVVVKSCYVETATENAQWQNQEVIIESNEKPYKSNKGLLTFPNAEFEQWLWWEEIDKGE